MVPTRHVDGRSHGFRIAGCVTGEGEEGCDAAVFFSCEEKIQTKSKAVF